MFFSLIIPAFNAEKTLKKCLDSVKKQNFSDFETIVVNDASTDITKEIIDQYKVKQIILKKNVGPAAARNAGIKKAMGKIIVFIDSDISFKEKNALSCLFKIFKKRKEIDGAIMIKDKIPLNPGLTPLYWAYYKYYLWNQPGEFQTSFTTERSALKREVFQKVGYFNEKYKKADVEDFEFGYRMNEKGLKLLIAREVKVLHHFETFEQSIKKMAKRSWMWIRLFSKRKKFDTVYSTQERGIKTLIGSLIFPLALLSFFPYMFYLFSFVLLIYLFLNIKFYLFLLKERRIILLPAFVFLDLLFSFVIISSAGLSIIFFLLEKKK